MGVAPPTIAIEAAWPSLRPNHTATGTWRQDRARPKREEHALERAGLHIAVIEQSADAHESRSQGDKPLRVRDRVDRLQEIDLLDYMWFPSVAPAAP
jgi:hypothetical protein